MTFEDEIEAFGYRVSSVNRHGERTWGIAYNRLLRFAVHEHGEDRVLVTWSFALGEHLHERGWQVSITDETAVELYPSRDVVIARTFDAVRGEMLRTLASLQLDLGRPDL